MAPRRPEMHLGGAAEALARAAGALYLASHFSYTLRAGSPRRKSSMMRLSATMQWPSLSRPSHRPLRLCRKRTHSLHRMLHRTGLTSRHRTALARTGPGRRRRPRRPAWNAGGGHQKGRRSWQDR
eukprot:166368-Pyramimonas_sp.AAC.1